MTTDNSGPSRRLFVGGLTTALAATTFSGGATAEQTVSSGAKKNTPLIANPVTEYPPPPFPAQKQDPPGLAGQMEPKPDHGETSYRGSGRLAGRKALIAGGDSGIERAAAIAFAREGADVAFNYLPVEEPDAREVVQLIHSAGRKAFPMPGDIRDEQFCEAPIADAVRKLGGLDILVNNAGHQKSQDSITDISTEQFDSTFRTNVYAMFWITKAAMPYLGPGAGSSAPGSQAPNSLDANPNDCSATTTMSNGTPCNTPDSTLAPAEKLKH
jgi:hypothetical protein